MTPEVVLSAAQIDDRVDELAREISGDSHGGILYVVAVLDNGFMLASDLARRLTCQVVCQFLKSRTNDVIENGSERRNIAFFPESEVEGKDYLLVDAVLQTGVTLEHLVNWFRANGARSVKTCVLIDRPEERRVNLSPDYWGFRVTGQFLVGYGMGLQGLYRNLPFVGELKPVTAAARKDG